MKKERSESMKTFSAYGKSVEWWFKKIQSGKSFFLLYSFGAILLLILIFFFILYPSNPSQITISNYHLLLINSLKDDESSCKLSEGEWVQDLNWSPLYSNTSCGMISSHNNCFKNGRVDTEFLNWRWKPNGCVLPTFDPKTFLRIVTRKKMAFIGDSLSRNHAESLLCILSKEEAPIDVYKDSEDRFRTWHFPSHDFTIVIIWSRFLVDAKEIVINGSNSGNFDLHLDKLDHSWAQQLPTLDYAIVSAAHWFFRKNYLYQNGTRIGCINCNEPDVTDHGIEFALRMSFRDAFKYINSCADCKHMTTLLRTFSPAHFENGTWDNGGSCNRVRPQREVEIESRGFYMEMRGMQHEEIERARKEQVKNKVGMKKRFEVLDVTRAMMMRSDGHPGALLGNKWVKGYNDCLHWCLPGPIDVWNDFLMAILDNKIVSFI